MNGSLRFSYSGYFSLLRRPAFASRVWCGFDLSELMLAFRQRKCFKCLRCKVSVESECWSNGSS